MSLILEISVYFFIGQQSGTGTFSDFNRYKILDLLEILDYLIIGYQSAKMFLSANLVIHKKKLVIDNTECYNKIDIEKGHDHLS